VERDPARAVRLYEELLEKEQCVSAFELGRMWETGEGVPRSLEKAAAYFRLARANRHPEAFVALKRIGFAPES
jgi:TPR repeat protein